jgi:fatty-acyl-CoA synthase
MRDISHWIDRNAGFHAEKPAIRFEGSTLTYAGLAARIDKMAAMLSAEIGANHGDRIAWLGFNHPDLLVPPRGGRRTV